jgi:hypothetical protein
MPREIALVLDTAAVRAFAAGSLRVGQHLAELPLGGVFAAVPVLCLAEAYREADAEIALHLDLLASHEAVVVTEIAAADAAVLGGWSRIVGSHDLANAALDAAEHFAPLMTAAPDAVSRVLAKGWPIIEIE